MAQVEIMLRKIRVEENGELTKKRSASVLYAELLYPRANVKSVEAMRVMKLEDAAEVDFEGNGQPGTPPPWSYADRVLFKQSVNGRCELRLHLVTTHQTSKLDKLLSQAFGAIFKSAWKLALGGISGDLLRKAGERAAGFHVESIEPKDASWVVGEGALELDEEHLPGVVRVPLKVGADIDVRQLEMEYGRPRHTTRRLAKRGEANGWVELAIQSY